MRKFTKIVLGILAGFVLIQLIPVNRKNPRVISSENFVNLQKTPEKISGLIKNACYDCHSNETVYPQYSYIAPISWSVKSHINDGRQHFNFSVWKSYNKDLKKSMLEKSVQTLQNKTMPMPAYIIYHKEANLSDAERALMMRYFQDVLSSEKY